MDTVDIKRLIYTASILLMSYLLVQLYTTIDQRPKVESVNYDSIQIPVINALSQSPVSYTHLTLPTTPYV